MTVRTNTNQRYYFRFLLIGLAVIGFGLWSLYDGAIAYPQQRERALAYQKLKEEDRGGTWHDEAQRRGWPTELPGQPKTKVDFIQQYIMAGVASTAGLLLLWVVYRARGRWIEATDVGLETSWGERFDFDQVIAIDKKRWREKGIATIKYQRGKRRKRMVLDNFKYDRDTTNSILHAVEAKAGAEKIIGGPPEAAADDASADDAS